MNWISKKCGHEEAGSTINDLEESGYALHSVIPLENKILIICRKDDYLMEIQGRLRRALVRIRELEIERDGKNIIPD